MLFRSSLVLDIVADFVDQSRASADLTFTWVPWDFRGFFDELSVPMADAMMLHRGVPDTARRWFVEMHSHRATLAAVTPWGLSPPVTRALGVHQGSCSAPLLSRFASEIVMRLEDSHAQPAVIGGIAVHQQSYVDDGNGFSTGAAGGEAIAKALSTGCPACGLGIDVKQGTAFTTGPPVQLRIQHIGLNGELSEVSLKGAPIEGAMKLLGVDSSWKGGAAETVRKLDLRIRRRLAAAQSRSCDVFELRSVVQMYICPEFAYAADSQRVPLQLAREWDNLIATAAKRALRVHPSTSSLLVFCLEESGGLGIPSCVANVLASRARELMLSFQGEDQQPRESKYARWGDAPGARAYTIVPDLIEAQ